MYTYAALRALLAWRPATFQVRIDGVASTVTGWAVAAANNRYYGGGMAFAPDAILDDGLLDVVLSAQTGKLRFLRSLPKVFSGAHSTSRQFRCGGPGKSWWTPTVPSWSTPTVTPLPRCRPPCLYGRARCGSSLRRSRPDPPT